MKVFDHHFSSEQLSPKSGQGPVKRPARDSEAEVLRKINEFQNDAHRVELSKANRLSATKEASPSPGGDISSDQSADQVAQKLKQSFQNGIVNFSGREKEVLEKILGPI
jgi:hypothetical protein